MAIEFVVRLNTNTYPESQVFAQIGFHDTIYHKCSFNKYENTLLKWLQELPYVYAEECFNGKRDIYITSALRVRFKVRVVTKRNGPMVVSGERWRAFALENLNPDVQLLHFVEEGDDCFYVTGYNRDGTELGGYNMIAGWFSRFQSRVFPYYDTLPAAFMDGLGNAHQITIKGDEFNFDVNVNTVQVGGANGHRVYEVDMEDWNNVEEHMGLEAGMILIFTRKRAKNLLITGFKIDGSLSTYTHFLGATSLRRIQPALLAPERDDDRMKHIFQWPSHWDHFGEIRSFYKRFSAIQVLQRLAIPADFLFNHPMHTYRKVLMKHRDIEYLMTMKMEFHVEDPERTNHVNVFGRWRMFARECSFKYEKMIRFKFMHMIEDVDRGIYLGDDLFEQLIVNCNRRI